MRQLIINKSGLENVKPKEFDKQTYTQDEPIKTSLLGTPIWSNLVIPAGNYETLEGDVIEFTGIELDSVLISLSMKKNIVLTAVGGSDGTVKEFISKGDYSISIQGALVSSESNVYPKELLADLIEILDAPVALKVESELLSFFNITEIVIESADVPQTAGFRNMQYFTINALSDTPVELR